MCGYLLSKWTMTILGKSSLKLPVTKKTFVKYLADVNIINKEIAVIK